MTVSACLTGYPVNDATELSYISATDQPVRKRVTFDVAVVLRVVLGRWVEGYF